MAKQVGGRGFPRPCVETSLCFAVDAVLGGRTGEVSR